MQNNQNVKTMVNALISKMAIDDKVDQLLITDLETLYNEIVSGAMPKVYGSVCVLKGADPKWVQTIDDYILNNTKLKIPVIYLGESLHGIMHPSTTIFPQSIAMGCTFNSELMGEVAEVIGIEARDCGLDLVFAPNLDLGREPRWGRTEETFSEDPHLVAELGATYVKNVQKSNVGCTLKHYVAHGSPEGGLNLSPVHAGERELRELYLEPFKAAIEAGVAAVMPAYSELDGEPLHSSRLLLRDILRTELGFNGITFSDFGAVKMLNSFHKVAKTPLEAGKMAIEAGVDIEAPTAYGYGNEFRQALKNGDIDIGLVDEAVSRILTFKYEHGLFDRNRKIDQSQLRKNEYAEISQKAAQESIVLLKNNGLLPLKKNSKIALIGPNALHPQVGDYMFVKTVRARSVSPKMAFEKYFGEENIAFAQGSTCIKTDSEMLNEAISAAQASDVVVLMLGESSDSFGGVGWGDSERECVVTCGEGFDLHDISLPTAQRELLKSIKSVGKPVVTVFVTGRPYIIGEATELADAALQMFYAGERGNCALVEIIGGDICPSGKLSISFPRSTGHIPCFYNHKPSARGYYKNHGSLETPGQDYVFDSPTAQFEFGYGLSYTSFEYSNLFAKRVENGVCVSVDVKNAGSYDAKESVLVFVSTEFCPVTQPIKKLRGFKKVFLKSGESRTVNIMLTTDSFTFVNRNMQKELASGPHRITVGDLKTQIII